MTLEQLRIFVAVAEREHMTRAAEALGLTQSTVSAAVSAIEARFAVPLFDRVGRHIELTAAGRAFLVEARAVLARAAAAERVLQDLSDLEAGTVAIRASQTIASYWLPAVLVAFRREHPKLEIELAIGNTAQVADAVLNGEVELGFVEGQVDQTMLKAEAVARDRLVLVVGASHPWARRGAVPITDLTAMDWVLRERGSGTRSEFEAALRQAGIDPRRLNVALELPSNEAVRAAVEAGAGATVISERVARAGIGSGTLHRVDITLPYRRFYALTHRERYRSKAVDTLISAALDHAGETGEGA
ncbi:LysR family transcriptional regulator [Kaustia mangrovi]|uniref:LysR family transcriptional regulator n=1 Tax=Kaustia mangrovi TaxID=2593653 RepID=A0A7S8C4N0_9HYPH|nr:LysR family transcriptional regulator [Kaustia mangrovi]QPC43301.1 LysR family transcriptional regulator [Kaustia mangrovi]